MREGIRYTLAVLAYIGLAMLTKRFLTWTWGPIYFVTVLEVLPRTVDLVRRWVTRLRSVEPSPAARPSDAKVGR